MYPLTLTFIFSLRMILFSLKLENSQSPPDSDLPEQHFYRCKSRFQLDCISQGRSLVKRFTKPQKLKKMLKLKLKKIDRSF